MSTGAAMPAWRLLDTGVASAAEKIARDEAVLRARAEGTPPDTVRFLEYSPPAVPVGYHQSPSREIWLDYEVGKGSQAQV